MADSNTAFTERVIYAGLRRMTDDRSAINSGYRYWQEHLSNDPFDIIDLVSKLVNYLGLSVSEKKRLMIALHAASTKLHDELEPLPGYLGGSVGAGGQTPQDAQTNVITKSIPPHIEAVSEYICVFSKFVERGIRDEYNDFVLAVEEISAEFSGEISQALLRFGSVQPSRLEFPASMSEQNARDLARHFHLLASEFIGPMEADRLHYQSVEQLLNMKFADRFDPRSLL